MQPAASSAIATHISLPRIDQCLFRLADEIASRRTLLESLANTLSPFGARPVTDLFLDAERPIRSLTKEMEG